jgi:cardiolipin synthase
MQADHELLLLRGADDYFVSLIAAIDTSVQEVRLETYILHLDKAVVPVGHALIHAAQRGVTVTLVVDGVGTPDLPADWRARFAAAGVRWHIYAPLGRWGLLVPSRWRRLHRKLCVIDGQVVFCGGINLQDDWFDLNHGPLTAPRFDFAVRVAGPLVRDVHAAMTQFWWRLQAVESARQVHWLQAWQSLQKATTTATGAHPMSVAAGHARAALVLRDNLRNRSRIERAYRLALGEARQDIILANAYFLPGRKIRRALIHAAQRGVRVRLLLQGRYEYFMQYHAAHALYGGLLEAGVEIYEYTVSFLHAKVAVIDGQWATVGSSNMDPLSLLLAREANVVVQDVNFSGQLRHELEQAIQHGARSLNLQQHRQRSWRQKLLDRSALLLMRLLLFVNGKRY